MDILAGLVALAAHISVPHVLALNLVGWLCKCFLHHRNWEEWTDAIPFVLAGMGVLFAYITPVKYEAHFIVYGLANAGLAWLLHRIVKDVPNAVRKWKKNGTGD